MQGEEWKDADMLLSTLHFAFPILDFRMVIMM
jgi:hypothetical protein